MQNDPREVLVEICHLMVERNFTTSSGGNISVRMPDGTFWITPSRLNKARVRIEDLVRVDAECRHIEGARKASSETLAHLAIYRTLPQAGAVVHAHPPASTGFAQAQRPMDTRSSSEAYFILGPQVPLIPYGRTGTPELADLIAEHLVPRHQAYLMANHGVITWAEDLWGAYDILDTLEVFAQTLLASEILGGPVQIPEEELHWLDTAHG
jgi:L-fuculose-phosphate aldolase